MYKNGRLTKDTRDKLTKIYQKERSKDSILSKFDRKYGKPKAAEAAPAPEEKRAEKKPVTPVVVEKKTVEAASAPRVADEDDLPDTPKRNRVIEQRKAAEALSGDLNWVSMIRYNQRETKKEAAMMQALAHDCKNMLKKDLEDQIKLRRSIRASEAGTKAAYQKAQNDEYADYEEKEKAKEGLKYIKVAKLKKMREDQVHDLERRRNREADKIRRREMREARRVQAEIKAEETKDARKKEEYKAMMKIVLQENDAQEEIKKKQREEEDADTVRLQKEYIKSLDAAELAKKEKLAATMKKQDEKLASLLDSTKAEREANRLAEERAERERVEKQAAKDAEMAARDAKRRATMDDCKRVIAEQIREKENRIRAEIEADREYGQKLVEDVVRAEAEEQAKVDRRKAKSVEQAKFIQEQVEAVERRKLLAMAEMSETEAKMNHQLLSCVLSGESMIKKPAINPSAPFEWRYKKTSKPF